MVDFFRDGTERTEGYRSSQGFKKASVRFDTDAMYTKHRTRFTRIGECACGLCRSHVYWKRLSRRQRRLSSATHVRRLAREVFCD